MLLALLACSDPRPRDLLLVTLDTTRADAIGAYGADPSPSPVLDALAAEGTLVSDAHTVVPLTLPAHATLLTGRDPASTGVHLNLSGGLRPDVPTLATILHDRGFQTGAFLGAAVLGRTFGLDRGFDLYDDRFDPTATGSPGDAVLRWPCREVEARAESWLATLDPDRPAFGWAHFYDAHQPVADYAAAITSMDVELGRLLSAWTERRGAPLVVVVGDHGESRGEHGEREHGLFLYEATTRIPWVMHGPGVPTGRAAGVRSIDAVAPTVLEILGVEAPPMDGEPLSAEPTTAVVESRQGRSQLGFADLRAVVTPEWRFVRAPRRELYDRRLDPHDLVDVAAAHPDVVAALEASLGTGPIAASDPADPSTAAMLARLGYVSGPESIAPDAPWDSLPDAKDHPDLPDRLNALVVAARSRPPVDAVPLIEAFLAEHPGVGSARLLLSVAHERAGQPAAAAAAIEPLLTLHPDDPALLDRKAALLLQGGDLDGAKRIADGLGGASAAAIRAEILRRRGQCAAAVPDLDAAIVRFPSAGTLHLVRGVCRYTLGDAASAEADLRLADGTDRDLWLGLALASQGKDGVPYLEKARGTPITDAALGLAYYAAGRWQDARTTLEPLAGRPDLGAQPLVALADATLRTGGSADDAAALLDRAETIGPDTAFAHRIRSAVAMARGDVGGSLAEMAKARAMSEEDPWVPAVTAPAPDPPEEK